MDDKLDVLLVRGRNFLLFMTLLSNTVLSWGQIFGLKNRTWISRFNRHLRKLWNHHRSHRRRWEMRFCYVKIPFF